MASHFTESLRSSSVSLESWLALARHTPLGILTDLDGTLIPVAPTPQEARMPPEVAALLETLAALPGVQLALVSGRPRESLEQALPRMAQNVFLVAEHGAWVRGEGAWAALADPPAEPLSSSLNAVLEPLVRRYPGSFLEPKTWSLVLHYRGVAPLDRVALEVEAASAVKEWLGSHPGYELLEGLLSLEVRPARIRKSAAVSWLRGRLGTGARLLALGDDVTDEDLFGALGPEDEAVLVGGAPARATAAAWKLASPSEAICWLEWVLAVRREAASPPPPFLPEAVSPLRPETQPVAGDYDLLVVSNRLPEMRSPVTPEEARRRNVGGLVSALEPVLKARSGLWFGWSGQVAEGDEPGSIGMDGVSQPNLAWVDLPRRWVEQYYGGLCNRAIWPLFHSFPHVARYDDEEWRCYADTNKALADGIARLVPPETAVWVHDYHLFLIARALRQSGHRGPIGHFLHIPFPPLDLFSMFPWAGELLDAMLEFDLLGFQTPGHLENFRQCVGALSPARVSDDVVEHRARRIRIGAFPIGIMPEDYEPDAAPDGDIAALLQSVAPAKLILGVDRLDYTKGIPARLRAFHRLLETVPEWRGKVSFVQVSVPSRADVPKYADERAQIETLVGRINGEFADGQWVPVRYLYRSYDRRQLSQLYRAADVGLVTPLRDGMNLVAKEFVAAQDPLRPGVLVLSRFAGAAAELKDAILTNPYHINSLAKDMDRALRLPLEERIAPHARLLAAVSRTTARTWAEDFLGTLQACRGGKCTED
ncbi:MAG: trehalose-phosphatase, partial [Bdellovibrionota bacterium]